MVTTILALNDGNLLTGRRLFAWSGDSTGSGHNKLRGRRRMPAIITGAQCATSASNSVDLETNRLCVFTRRP